MKDATRDRREFLRNCAGVAAAAAIPGACARSDRAHGTPDFATAWQSAVTDVERQRAIRDQFLIEPGYTYLNTAGLGPTPEPVHAAVVGVWERLERRSETGHGERAPIRARAASFLGCNEDELAFTRNATEGMNLVARGLGLARGDTVLMTTHEHPGGAMPWFGLRGDTGMGIHTFDPGSGGADTLARLNEALSVQPRVLMVSHVTCTTGLVLPVREIGEICRRRGIILVLDGAQVPGQIAVDLHGIGCDFWVASGHKWLLGPKETGLLYVRDEWLDRWRPDHVGAYSDSGFDLAAGRFDRLRPASASEYGTRSTPLLTGLGAAIEFLETIGMDAVAAHGAGLASRLRTGIESLDAVEILTPPDFGASILTFRLPAAGGTPGEWVNRLRTEHGFRLRPVGEAGLDAVRASPHVCNSEEEMDQLIGTLTDLL